MKFIMREFELMFLYAGSWHQYFFQENMEHEFGKNTYIDDSIISEYLNAYFKTYPDKVKEGAKATQIILYEKKNGQYEKLYEPTKYY